MGSGAKPHKSRCCLTACAVILALLLVSSLGGLGGVSYFLRRLVPFTDVGVLKTLTGCGRCPECMACLSGFTGEDVNALCDPLANVFQCVVQFFYLYDRDDYGQPCYDECHACEECLDATTFGALGKLDKTLWETTFPDFLHTPESMGLDNYTVDCSDESQDVCMLLFNASDSFHERQKRQASLDMGCETASEVLPYTLVHRDAEGTTWYPIWFNIPWNELPRQYQFYHRVECL